MTKPLSEPNLTASAESQPGYRATHIQVFPNPSVPPYTLGDSFAALAERKKKRKITLRKPNAQNKAQHLDKKANRQRTHQEENKTGNYKTQRNEQV